MSRFFNDKLSKLDAYTPGEQPKDMQYIKLNTNESPYPPSPSVSHSVAQQAVMLQLYSDPECWELRKKIADLHKVDISNILVSNGSDDILNFAFAAFSGSGKTAIFPDITYGFYPVFANLNRVPYKVIPLNDDFSISPADYYNAPGPVFIANPNAPTGIALNRDEIESIVASNPDNVVVIDEAYVDFGAESCYPLTAKYDNLLVVQTFSKSRSLAGGRLGFAIGCRELIDDITTIKFSTNPYSVNRMTMAAGIAAIDDNSYYMANCLKVAKTREYVISSLKEMGFEVIPSKANFVFAKHPAYEGEYIYTVLKQKGVLVRHFTNPKICDYNRITIGSPQQMEKFLQIIKQVVSE